LIPKSRDALQRYGHQVVIGNELHRRKFEVVFVSRANESNDGDSSTFVESWIRLQDDQTEIEDEIVRELVKRHGEWIKSK
jgi:phosphopantothenate---cysteine ligase (ATP)